MTTVGKSAELRDILKHKMNKSKEDLERVRDENEELLHKIQVELQRREAVSRDKSCLFAVHVNLNNSE